jgi:hypothetical protein
MEDNMNKPTHRPCPDCGISYKLEYNPSGSLVWRSCKDCRKIRMRDIQPLSNAWGIGFVDDCGRPVPIGRLYIPTKEERGQPTHFKKKEPIHKKYHFQISFKKVLDKKK